MKQNTVLTDIHHCPFLSIVIPVYNNDRFISFCLDSLLVHQVIKKELYEIIIVNDGSCDDSLSIIKCYENKYSNVSVISQENSGVSVARNTGIDASKGEFIWFVDGDDFVKANCIESIILELATNNDVFHFSGFRFNQVDFYEKMLFEDFKGTSQPDIWTYIFKMDFLKKNNIRFEKGIHYAETQLFVNDVYLNNPKQQLSTNTYYFYRVNEYSVSATNRQRKISCYFDLFELLEKRLEDQNYPMDNTLHQIESILRMRFLCAMDDRSVVTNDQINRGKRLSKYLSDYISSHNIPKKEKKAFKDYKKLCEHFDRNNWNRYLNRWRKNYRRKKAFKNAVMHPKRTVKKIKNYIFKY